MGKYPVVTLCGSTKFKKEFLEVQKILALKGNIVISLGLFGHSGDEEVWNGNNKEMLNDMHLQRIEMADKIMVIDVNGYMGEDTRREIRYAEDRGITVEYLSQQGFELSSKPKSRAVILKTNIGIRLIGTTQCSNKSWWDAEGCYKYCNNSEDEHTNRHQAYKLSSVATAMNIRQDNGDNEWYKNRDNFVDIEIDYEVDQSYIYIN